MNIKILQEILSKLNDAYALSEKHDNLSGIREAINTAEDTVIKEIKFLKGDTPMEFYTDRHYLGYRERLLETVILALLKEIHSLIDITGIEGEVLEGNIWVDTKDRKKSIYIDINWELLNPTIKATAFPFLKVCSRHKCNLSKTIQEDCTGQEELFLDISMEKDEDE